VPGTLSEQRKRVRREIAGLNQPRKQCIQDHIRLALTRG
jgi:hypothetical protein